MAEPIARVSADFFFKYFRSSWRERYWLAAVPSLEAALRTAQTLATWRVPLLGNDGTVEGSPYLDRIIVSRGDAQNDTLEATFFRDKTIAFAIADFVGDKAANPQFTLEWETTATTGFARTRFLSGVPSSILGFVAPESHTVFKPAFQSFSNALKTTWGYILTGSGPGASAEEAIAYIEPSAANFVRIWSDPVPAQGDDVEIRYTRFLKGSEIVRGNYVVSSVGAGYFEVFQGPNYNKVQYHHGGIWRFPSTRFIPFDGTSLLTGLTSHKRGVKTHARRGRSRPRKPTVF